MRVPMECPSLYPASRAVFNVGACQQSFAWTPSYPFPLTCACRIFSRVRSKMHARQPSLACCASLARLYPLNFGYAPWTFKKCSPRKAWNDSPQTLSPEPATLDPELHVRPPAACCPNRGVEAASSISQRQFQSGAVV